MKHIYWIIFLLLFFTNCNQSNNKTVVNQPILQPSLWEIIDTSCTIGIVALEMEKAANLNVEANEYLFIDDFINLLQPLISSKTAYSEKEALQILQTIDYAIRRNRQQQMEYESAFSTCIRYRIFDCDINRLVRI
ncbi:MAG: hypothetical protein R3E32_29535 [Chitinophagales bacterium]